MLDDVGGIKELKLKAAQCWFNPTTQPLILIP
jgi:hypothetical protein